MDAEEIKKIVQAEVGKIKSTTSNELKATIDEISTMIDAFAESEAEKNETKYQEGSVDKKTTKTDYGKRVEALVQEGKTWADAIGGIVDEAVGIAVNRAKAGDIGLQEGISREKFLSNIGKDLGEVNPQEYDAILAEATKIWNSNPGLRGTPRAITFAAMDSVIKEPARRRELGQTPLLGGYYGSQEKTAEAVSLKEKEIAEDMGLDSKEYAEFRKDFMEERETTEKQFEKGRKSAERSI